MDMLKKESLTGAIAGLIVGFFIGWMLMGWVIWPVEYVDGNVYQLRASLQQDYARMLSRDYLVTGDLDRAAGRVRELGANGRQILTDLATSSPDDAGAIQQLQADLEAQGKWPQFAASSGGSNLLMPLLACLVVIVLGVLVAFLYMRMLGSRPKGPATTTQLARQMSAEAVKTDYSAPTAVSATPTGAPPVAQFMTTYVLGDDLYDDSFSIEDQGGNFLGECGMGISETIGVGDPKKVTAFEVWVFDKNDIKTVTKVLMSKHAFSDEALKSRLSAKGEPQMMEPGKVVSLETATLIITARVVDLAYGGGALPPDSFMERLTIELAAFPKPAA